MDIGFFALMWFLIKCLAALLVACLAIGFAVIIVAAVVGLVMSWFNKPDTVEQIEKKNNIVTRGLEALSRKKKWNDETQQWE